MKQRFKIVYPEGYYDASKVGKEYIPPLGCFVVMSTLGVVYFYDGSRFEVKLRFLSEVLTEYDVVWEESV